MYMLAVFTTVFLFTPQFPGGLLFGLEFCDRMFRKLRKNPLFKFSSKKHVLVEVSDGSFGQIKSPTPN